MPTPLPNLAAFIETRIVRIHSAASPSEVLEHVAAVMEHISTDTDVARLIDAARVQTDALEPELPSVGEDG